MLKPQQNNYRDKISLDGIWKFKVDTEDIGIQNNWHLGLSSFKQIAVPSSWNEIDSELSDYICLLYTSPSPRDVEESRMPSSA